MGWGSPLFLQRLEREREKDSLCLKHVCRREGVGFPLLSLFQICDRNQPGNEDQKSSPEEELLPVRSF